MVAPVAFIVHKSEFESGSMLKKLRHGTPLTAIEAVGGLATNKGAHAKT